MISIKPHQQTAAAGRKMGLSGSVAAAAAERGRSAFPYDDVGALLLDSQAARPGQSALRGTHGRVGDLQPRLDGGGVAGTHQEVRPGLSARQSLQGPCPSPGEILMQDEVVALFAYDRWANTKVLDA